MAIFSLKYPSLLMFNHYARSSKPTGRARWKIENETFRAAKNQGYHMEHSYCHDKQYHASVLGGLMFLAFLIDQVQESFCRVFGEIRTHHKSRRNLWERLRAAFTTVKASD